MSLLSTLDEKQKALQLHAAIQQQLQFGIDDYLDEMERESLEGL